jgi:transcriptional regulator with XRE-family HTH domain
MVVEREQLGWWPPLTFGQRLRMIRHEYGRRCGRRVTQREMAALIDVSEGNYAAWEAGNGIPSDNVGVAKRIGQLTGADPLWLLGWFDEPSPAAGPRINESTNQPAPDDGGATPSTKWYPAVRFADLAAVA